MPILTISELVLAEISQMRFLFGGTPADVVEYEDGGRKASGQAISVSGMDAVTDTWGSLETSVVPVADETGMIPEFYGPKGILALRVDFGHGEVILRADAANLHKELRDILIARLSELQVDEENFRQVVTAEIDAMRSELDNAIATTLAEVEVLIDTSLGAQIEQAVDDKLATDLAPTLEAAVNEALATDIPPLITAEVGEQVPTAVSAEVSGLQAQINVNASEIDAQGVTLANTRYDLDATKARVTTAEQAIDAVEVLVTLTEWNKTHFFSDCAATLKVQRFQGVVFGSLHFLAASANNGSIGYVARTGMGIPAQFLPSPNWNLAAARAIYSNGQIINPDNFFVGISNDGRIVSQGYEPWNELYTSFVYFTS